MKFNKDDILKIRSALLACKIAGLDSVVISQGMLRGLSDKQHGAVFSTMALSIDPELDIGISKLGELEKRLTLFGEEIAVEVEITDAKKARKLTVKGHLGKIEFRCTDSKLIKYPKENNDEVMATVSFTKPEIALMVKGAKVMGAEQLVIQVKRDGGVHVEALDQNNDRFELDASMPAEFINDAYPSVNSFDTSSNGVFIAMLEHAAKDADTVTLELTRAGQFRVQAYGHTLLAIPRIQLN